MKNLLTSVGLGALLAASPALAQTAPAPQAPPAPPAPTTTAENGISEIIVTASRRSESLQRAALAVTALPSDLLVQRGAQNVTDITRIVPSVKVGQVAGSGLQVTVRGIGNFGGNSFAEPGVAFNLDGVYLARSAGASGIFYDVNRIELLKGPQGTLYGRNSTGGVLNILTNDPGRKPAVNVIGEYGNPNRWRAEAAVNVPLGETIAIRVAAQRTKSDGFSPDGSLAENNYAGRIKALFKPSTAFSLLLEADYSKLKDGVLSGGFKVPGFHAPRDLTCGPTSLQNTVIPNAPAGAPYPPTLQVLPLIKCNSFNDNSARGLQGTANYDFGPVAATLIVANRWSKAHYLHYGAGFPVHDDTRNAPSEYTTAEFRLASPSRSRFKWVLGTFYYDDDLHTRLTFDQGLTYQVPDIHIYTKSYSAFAEGTLGVTDRLRVTAGGRYTEDKKRMIGVATGPVGLPFAPAAANFGLPAGVPPAATCPTNVAGVTYNPAPSFGPDTGNPFLAGSCTTPLRGARKFDKFTWKAGLEFDLAPTSLLYATVSTGFKAGGFYASLDTTGLAGVPQQGNSYLPETLTAYTLGSKNRLLDNRLQLNLEAFYWKYKNKQYTHLGVVQPGNANNLIVDNAGAAEIYGLEGDVIFQPSRNDSFALNAQYSHAKYTVFRYTALFQGPRPTVTCAVGPITAAGRFNSALVDCSGKPVSFAPKWNVNLSYYHTFNMANGSRVVAGASTQIQSTYYVGEEYLPDERQGSSMISNAELGWRSANDLFGVTAFVKNIENKSLLTTSFVYPFTGAVRQGLGFPRTYGVRVNVRY